MRIRVYGSAQALYCVANALYWKSFKRQIFTYLTVLKHQNTKTSLYELSKNHWVIALFEIFGSVSKKLQSTVFNDHPVVHPRTARHPCEHCQICYPIFPFRNRIVYFVLFLRYCHNKVFLFAKFHHTRVSAFIYCLMK